MRHLLTLLFALAVATTAGAQTKHNVYVWVDGQATLVENADSITFRSPDEPGQMEAVDLGLSVRWAACNVGAEYEADFGYHFAWGETAEKDDYQWATYAHGIAYNMLTKYTNDPSFGLHGFVDDKLTLDPEDDAATALLGQGWRTPTTAEMQELVERCQWEESYQMGVAGMTVTGPNGNAIFLPHAGRMYGDVLYQSNSSGFYWTADVDAEYNVRANYLNTASNMYEVRQYNRYFGFSVRAVRE